MARAIEGSPSRSTASSTVSSFDVGDGEPVDREREDLGGEATAAAPLAHRVLSLQEREVGVDDPGAVALGARTLRVGAEQGGPHPVGPGEQLAHRRGDPRVRDRRGPAVAAHGSLVDDDGLVLVDQHGGEARLAGTGDAGEHGEHAGGDIDRHVAQVVEGGVAHGDRPGRASRPVVAAVAVAERPTGRGVGGLQLFVGAVEHEATATGPRLGTDLEDLVGNLHDRRIVLDDQHGVAAVAELLEQADHRLDVARVEADGRLVEHVDHLGEAGPEVLDGLDALRLATGQRGGGAVEREVAEPDRRDRTEPLAQRVDDRRHASHRRSHRSTATARRSPSTPPHRSCGRRPGPPATPR